MTWFKVDDQFPDHPKARMAGKDGRALWLAAGAMAARHNTDGLVNALMLQDAAYRAEVVQDDAAKALVAAGLWHDPKTLRKCDPCKAVTEKLPQGCYVFHDWLDYQLTKDEAKLPEIRRKARRAKALRRNTEMREAIVARDGSRCRYCGQRVNFKDHRGVLGGTYDHVDPDGENVLENVVVACRGCNSRKGERTPEEAEMALLPVPTKPTLVPAPAENEQWESGRDLDQSQDGFDRAAEAHTRAHATPALPGRDWVGHSAEPSRGQVVELRRTDGLSPDGPASSATVSPLHGEGDEIA